MGVKILERSRSRYREEQLDRIEGKIDAILIMEVMDMADEAALDEALAGLSTQLDELQSAAQSVLEKVSTLPDAPDLTDEIATIQGFGDKLATTTQAMKDAVAAPAEEVPPVE
jgi:hypothetical protein